MIAPLLHDAFQAFGDDSSTPVVIDGSGAHTWRAFAEDIAEMAREMESEEGPIGILLPSGASFLGVFLAAASVGRPACTLHRDWAEPELAAAIEDADLSTVYSDREAVPGGAKVKAPKASSGGSREGDTKRDLARPMMGGDEDPLFYIGYTSGTSGRPKPFTRRQRSWSTSFSASGEIFSINRGDTVFLLGSLQHSHFLFGAVLGLNRGAGVRLFEHFDVPEVDRELRQQRAAVVYLVPTMLTALDGTASPFGGVHSVVVSGSKMESHHWGIARRLFPNAVVGEIYGASELSFVTVNTEGEISGDPGYVGRAFPGVEIEIRPSDRSLGHRSGVVYVRSPYLFDGYIDGEEIVSPAATDGFITVGDIGVLDEDEGLSLVGRESNLLITGGKNVHPEEIEGTLNLHPGVRESVVVGIPHPHWGDELVAYVALEDSTDQPVIEDLRIYLRDRIASYKIPKRWTLIEELPRTSTGKIARAEVKALGGSPT